MTDQASFDPTVFLNQQYDEQNDTKVVPCPAGETLGIAEKVTIVPWAKKDGSSSGLKCVVLWEVQDQNIIQLLGRDKVIVPQDIMLDLTEANGLDFGKGKNVRLGRLREALGLNKPGEPFAFSMIQGRLAKINVKHRVDGEDIYGEVDKVAAPE